MTAVVSAHDLRGPQRTSEKGRIRTVADGDNNKRDAQSAYRENKEGHADCEESDMDTAVDTHPTVLYS